MQNSKELSTEPGRCWYEEAKDRYITTCDCGSMAQLLPTKHQEMLGTGGYRGRCNKCGAVYTMGINRQDDLAHSLENLL